MCPVHKTGPVTAPAKPQGFSDVAYPLKKRVVIICMTADILVKVKSNPPLVLGAVGTARCIGDDRSWLCPSLRIQRILLRDRPETLPDSQDKIFLPALFLEL